MQRYYKLFYQIHKGLSGDTESEQQARELAGDLGIDSSLPLKKMKTVLDKKLQAIEPLKVRNDGMIASAQRHFDEKFYHLEQVAKKLNITTEQVKELVTSGQLNAVDVSDIENCKCRVLESDLAKIMGVEDASKLWGLAPSTVKDMCAAGKVTARKIGKTWVIPKDHPNPKNKKEE